MVCAVYHDMHDDDSGMWTKKESGEEKIGKSKYQRAFVLSDNFSAVYRSVSYILAVRKFHFHSLGVYVL